MKHLLAELGDFADLVLVDSPPLLASSDVVVVAPLTDGALLVVDPRHVRRSNIEQARREFELIGVPVIGVVVNQLDPNRFRAYGSSYSHYGVREQSGAPSSANGFGSPDPSNEPGVPNDRDLGQLSSP